MTDNPRLSVGRKWAHLVLVVAVVMYGLILSGAGRVWSSPLGEQPCPDPSTDPPLTVCWRIRADDPATPEDDGVTDVAFATPTLRGGEAQREAKDVTIKIAAGCHTTAIEDCRQVRTSTQRYERAVFSQYQLHYDTNEIPPEALNGPDGLPDDPGCHTDPPSPPPGAVCDDVDPATIIVFTSDDNLNGPLRYTGTGPVLYCGSPTIRRIETNIDAPPVRPEFGGLAVVW